MTTVTSTTPANYRRPARHTRAVALIIIAVAVLTSCTATDPAATLRRTPNRSTSHDSTGANRPTTSSVRLGKLSPPPNAAAVGAPFDPCTVLSWKDFPEPVQPQAARPRKPSRRTPGPNSAFDIGCAFVADGPLTVGTGRSSSGTSAEFNTWIVWGADMNATPPESTPQKFGTAKGSLIPGRTTAGAAMCTGWAKLRSGVAAVSTVNSRAPQLDTCDLVTNLLTRIVDKHN